MGEGFGERGARRAAGGLRIYRPPAHFFFVFLKFFLAGSRGAFYRVYGFRGVHWGVAFGDLFENSSLF